MRKAPVALEPLQTLKLQRRLYVPNGSAIHPWGVAQFYIRYRTSRVAYENATCGASLLAGEATTDQCVVDRGIRQRAPRLARAVAE